MPSGQAAQPPLHKQGSQTHPPKPYGQATPFLNAVRLYTPIHPHTQALRAGYANIPIHPHTL
jgi:hypothetical protein